LTNINRSRQKETHIFNELDIKRINQVDIYSSTIYHYGHRTISFINDPFNCLVNWNDFDKVFK